MRQGVGEGGGEQGGSTMDDITQYMQYLWKNTKDAANCIKNISKCDTTIVIMSDSLGVGGGVPKSDNWVR